MSEHLQPSIVLGIPYAWKKSPQHRSKASTGEGGVLIYIAKVFI